MNYYYICIITLFLNVTIIIVAVVIIISVSVILICFLPFTDHVSYVKAGNIDHSCAVQNFQYTSA